MMAEPISLTIGGNSHWGIAIVDNDGDNASEDMRIANDVELKFKGSTVLDSGVEVGMQLEIEGEQDDDQGDEAFAWVSGSFGELRIGNTDPASKKFLPSAPQATWFWALNSPWWAGSISSAGSVVTFPTANAGDGASLMYFSPVINGFQFGLSYTPEAGEEAQSDVADNPKKNDVATIGAGYNGSFGDAGVGVGFGYGSNEQDNGNTVTDMAVGASVSMSDVTIGGSYRSQDNDDGSDKITQYDVGIQYSMGAMSVSVNYGGARQDNMVDKDLARLLANYNLGPGIDIAGAVGSDTNSMSDEDTTFAGVALSIYF